MPKRDVNSTPIDTLDAEFLDLDLNTSPDVPGMSLAMLSPDYMSMDPSQPRRNLPNHLYNAIHNNEISVIAALRQFVSEVRETAATRGRPFHHPCELLNLDEPPTEDEEELLKDLFVLAVTMQQGGLVNPITVVDLTEGTRPHYLVETGERRFLAALLYREYLAKSDEQVLILCRVIPTEQYSAFRQARENSARKPLNAIGRARQLARLLLEIHDIPPTYGPADNDYYRQALDLNLREKHARERISEISAAMGGISKSQISKLKNLLRLSDRALEYGDRHNLSENTLGLLLNFSDKDQEWYIDLAEQNDWNAHRLEEQLREALKPPVDEEIKQASALVRSIRREFSAPPEQIAEELLAIEGDIYIATARLKSRIEFLSKVHDHLTNQ